MSNYRATGKVCTLGTTYNSLDPAFKRVVDQIIDSKGDGHCLLRLLRLTSTTQTPTTLLSSLLKKYDRENHYFKINGHHLNVTLEDILYLTGLPIDGKAVISSTSRDKEAFERVFTSLDTKTVNLPTLKSIVINESKANKERLTALLLIVIVCFVTPVQDDYIVHNYLVQFVENFDEVDNYAWGAALLSTFYCGIENDKKLAVDGNCWPLLVRP